MVYRLRVTALSAILLLTASCLLTAQSHAQTFGRVFSTPAERESLDQQRYALLSSLDDAQRQAALTQSSLDAQQVVNARPILIHMGGIVRRSDGTHTIWLNGMAVSETALPPNVELDMSSGLGVLRVNTPGAVYSLRTGQTLNPETGELRESFQVTAEQRAAIAAEIARRDQAVIAAPEVIVPPEEAADEVPSDDEEEAVSDDEQTTLDSVLSTLQMLQDARDIQESLQ
jgi:hypothetical protein